MKRLGVALLMLLVLLHAGTAFAEKHASQNSWWDASQQIDTYMQSIAIAREVVQKTVDTALLENAEQLQTHGVTVTKNAKKEIIKQKEAYLTQLEESKKTLLESDMFQSFHDEKKAELDESLEAETKAIIKSILMESKSETK
ncbi:hypothetical protein [Oceanobacillus jordanicus]|uniref:Sporulation protein n=1 Tax=Oceanobacillus jordanicus TaxID=2867266 RepID=A0AAW5B620_9BACI|nr:hypothetical protein [Oceanobacillus jordanicus]MCG3419875.1 hypothetical protein [Oceanobacillus jordanicus]